MNHVNITRRFIFASAAVLALAACHHQSGPAVPAAPSAPDETVRQFLAAVNANDLDRMALLFGTENGPMPLTSPNSPDTRHKQLVIMQRLLLADSFRVVSIEPVPSHASHRRIEVELMRGAQRASVPFVLVPSRTGGWLVFEFDSNAALALSGRGISN